MGCHIQFITFNGSCLCFVNGSLFCEFVATEEDADGGNSMEVDLDAFDLSLVGFETIDEDGATRAKPISMPCASLFYFKPVDSKDDADEACSAH